LLLGSRGGVDIEAHADSVARLALDAPDIEESTVLTLARQAGIDAGLGSALVPVVGALWACYRDQEAELIEINPLVETTAGRLVAADARLALDDSASFRHADRPAGGRVGTVFERRCADLGAVGIEMDGDIAAIVSGAGLMMATVDLLVDDGGSVRAAVDLGGLVLREADELSGLIGAIGDLQPKALLINASFQLATCDALARKLAAGLARRPLGIPIVVRLRGRGLDEARDILEPYGVVFERDLEAACASVLGAAHGQASKAGAPASQPTAIGDP
jgi:succinyl-CoA synthetase beta subunit